MLYCRHTFGSHSGSEARHIIQLPDSIITNNYSKMRLSAVAIALSVAALASAQLTFNITQALKPGNFAKYRCL